MVNDSGWLCPFQDARNTIRVLTDDSKFIDSVVSGIPIHRTAIQAGGNVGIYPARLARYFDRVISFEPDGPTFHCLEANLKERGVSNVDAVFGALGAEAGTVRMENTKPNIGTSQVKFDGGEVPIFAIDDLPPTEVNLIWLDVEGMETPALKGAAMTIDLYRPWIVLEQNQRWKGHLEYDPIAGGDWLCAEHSYIEVDRQHLDVLFCPTEVWLE